MACPEQVPVLAIWTDHIGQACFLVVCPGSRNLVGPLGKRANLLRREDSVDCCAKTARAQDVDRDAANEGAGVYRLGGSVCRVVDMDKNDEGWWRR